MTENRGQKTEIGKILSQVCHSEIRGFRSDCGDAQSLVRPWPRYVTSHSQIRHKC